MDRSVNGGEGVNQNSFSLKKRKDAECSEMEKYAKMFCDIFARVSVKNIFPDIFIKYWNFSKHFSFRIKVFFFHKNIHTYVLDHFESFDMHNEKLLKKIIRKENFFLPFGAGRGLDRYGLFLNNIFFYAFPYHNHQGNVGLIKELAYKF